MPTESITALLTRCRVETSPGGPMRLDEEKLRDSLSPYPTYQAICPGCNDWMECINFDESSLAGGERRAYQCFGCDKIFVFQEVTP